MESARELAPDATLAHRQRMPAPTGLNSLEKVLRFALPGRDDAGAAPTRTSPVPSARDLARALELIHEAAQAMRASEERAREGEARNQALAQRATEELRAAEAKIQGSEARARAAEARVHETEERLREAEARTTEIETWLAQIFSTISEELPLRN